MDAQPGEASTGAQLIPVIDTHVHFWDLGHPELRYDWLQPDVQHPILGDIEGIKHRRFDPGHLWSEARFAAVEGFVHVQAALGTADPVAETAWLDHLQEVTGHPAAHVAHADLAGADIERVLDRHAAYALVRGVRDFSVEHTLASGESQSLDPGLCALVRHDLVLDLDCSWQNMAKAAGLAQRHPDLRIVLEHVGYPRNRDPDYMAGWRTGIGSLAAAPNVSCKISGLGMGDPGWTPASLSPLVDHCLETFGADRCVVGTNWPVDRLYSSYDAVLGALRGSLSSLTHAEQEAVLHGNARSVYRL